jgi:hypothetical protein
MTYLSLNFPCPPELQHRLELYAMHFAICTMPQDRADFSMDDNKSQYPKPDPEASLTPDSLTT